MKAAQPKSFAKRNSHNLFLISLMILFVMVFFAHRMFIFVDAGHAGVLFRRLFGGVVTTRTYGEGFYIIPPWDSMTIYDMRVQEILFKYKVLSSNGLDLDVSISARTHPYWNALPLLHQRIGPDYIKKVVTPVVEASVRKAVGDHRAEDLYSDVDVVYQINQETSAELGESFIALDRVLIRSIAFPKFIQEAIEKKEEQRELLEAYGYRLRREKDEAVRKEIEAFGWQNFNNIVGPTLSPRLLQWRGIEATRELANSPNSKLVIMGNGDHGLPVMLNADVSNSSGAPAGRLRSSQEILKNDVISTAQVDTKIAGLRQLFNDLLKKDTPAPATAGP